MAINSALDVSISSLANASRGINRVAADIARTGVAAKARALRPNLAPSPSLWARLTCSPLWN